MAGPYSFKTFSSTGNAGQVFAFSEVDYLSRAHITVLIDGEETTNFYWDGLKAVVLDPPAPSGSVVTVRRTTPVGVPWVTFNDASILLASDLDATAAQALFLAQEVLDSEGVSLGLGGDGQWDAEGRAIRNVGNPTFQTDATPRFYADVVVAQAQSFADAASGHAQGAADAKVAAELARDSAVQASEEAELLASLFDPANSVQRQGDTMTGDLLMEANLDAYTVNLRGDWAEGVGSQFRFYDAGGAQRGRVLLTSGASVMFDALHSNGVAVGGRVRVGIDSVETFHGGTGDANKGLTVNLGELTYKGGPIYHEDNPPPPPDAGEVASLAFAGRINPTTEVTYGETVLASELFPAAMMSNLDLSGDGSGSRNGYRARETPLPGNLWRCLGHSPATSFSNISASITLWQRIS